MFWTLFTASVPLSSETSVTSVVPIIPESTLSSPFTYPVETSVESTPATYPVESGSSVVPTTPESTPSIPATYPVSSSTSVVSYPAQTYPGSASSIPLTSSLGNSPTEATSSPSVPETRIPVYTTEVVYTTLTTCPITNTITTSGIVSYQTSTTVSTITGTITSTVSVIPHTSLPSVPESSVLAVTSGNSPIPASSASPSPSAPCPSVLPQCLNTWIKLTTCENNAASDCYCTNSEFTKNVQDCVTSWSYDDNEIQAALSYLAGICAPHVAANPGIVTHVPKTITLVPTPAVATPVSGGGSGVTAAPVGSAPASGSQPQTVITISTATVIPVSYTTGPSSGSPIPSSSTTSIIQTAGRSFWSFLFPPMMFSNHNSRDMSCIATLTREREC